MAITNPNNNDKYVCTYRCSEDRDTECDYWGRICEQCPYFVSKKELLEDENNYLRFVCPFDECVNLGVLCIDCYVNRKENVYFDEDDIEDFDFDIEDDCSVFFFDEYPEDIS